MSDEFDPRTADRERAASGPLEYTVHGVAALSDFDLSRPAPHPSDVREEVQDVALRQEAVRDAVALAARGDAQAFQRLHARFCRYVHAILVANGCSADAEDIEQEVFLSAWRHLRDLRSHEHFPGWLATIARTHAQRGAARIRRRPHPIEGDVIAHDARSGLEVDVLAVLRELPEAYRETLALRLIEGLSGQEIATLTGLTHGSVRVNLTRGMELLRAALSERGWR